MDRRQFLRGLGIFGIGAGASAPALADSKKPKIPKEILDKLDEGHQHFTITVAGDGTGCEAVPIITNGTLTSVSVTNPGSGYTYATATVNGVGSGG